MFRTEKQTEEDLQQETRLIPMPDGSMRPVRMFTCQWKKLPCALWLFDDNLEELVDQTLEHQRDNPGRDFTKCFSDVLHYWNLEYRKMRLSISD
uniref:Uncharacterized protein n=1 Tax=Roseihalotalea indica TaxID=2867963 RepID=A0AA49GHT6_9BACT|nr:hypothetical protein K4G66_18485 [Tunicatimonas sp. TK19036]